MPSKILIRQLLLILSISLLSNLAHAHAVVTHSSLSTSTIAPFTAEQVRLTFNSKVELDLSQIYLVSRGDKMIKVKAAYSKTPGKVLIAIPPLSPGEYALKLSIFAADGHLSEDLLRFFVTEQAE